MTLIRVGSYRLGRTLGVGSFGKVKLAEHEPTGKKVAVKILNRQKLRAQQMEEKLKREIKILKMCMHPHIIKLYEVIETSTDIYVIIEFSPGGELFDYIVERGRLSEVEARRFFQQIISGVEYCHKHMIAHRDLKPENLLLDEQSNVKIADFGLSNCLKDGCFLKTSCGSPNYAAPEVISGKLYAGPEVDVWSCGVIVYALLCGTLPFDDESIPYLFRKIKGGIYILPSYLSESSKDIIKRMLDTDPLKRITVSQIRKHPWFLNSLPRYLAIPIRIGAHLQNVDDRVVDQAAQCTQFPRDKIVKHLRRGRRNHYTVAYHLFKDAQAELDLSTMDSPDGSAAKDGTGVDTGGIGKANVGVKDSINGGVGVSVGVGGDGDGRDRRRNNIDNISYSGNENNDNSKNNNNNKSNSNNNNSNNKNTTNKNDVTATDDEEDEEDDDDDEWDMMHMAVSMAAIDLRRLPPLVTTSNVNGIGILSDISNGDTNEVHDTDVDTRQSTSIERKWDVGIRCRQRSPVDAMMEVYHALNALQWRWKTPANQSFQIRVLVEKPGLDRPIRMCLQLFKTSSRQHQEYQLDIQRIDGDLIAYFASCCELKKELQ